MKVLMINGSPRVGGNTSIALAEMQKIFEENGIETEIIQVGNKDIRGCIGCGYCFKNRCCTFDDIVNDIAPRFEACDGLVIGSPVYYAAANGTLVSLLDRLFYAAGSQLRGKPAASVVSCRRGGASAAFEIINKYFMMTNMPIVTSQYWNQVHGNTPEEVKKDLEGLQTMRTLARNMVFLMKSIALGKEAFGLPEKEKSVWTNFVR